MADNAFYEVGDYICPSYTPGGRRKTEAKIGGSAEEIKKITDRLSEHAKRSGATLLPVVAPPVPVKAKGRKKKGPAIKTVAEAKAAIETPAPRVIDTVGEPDYTPMVETSYSPAVPMTTLTFETSFCTITFEAEFVMQESNAMCIVFTDEKAIKLVPNPGAEFVVILNDQNHYPVRYSVMYPGFKFKDKDGKVYMTMAIL